MSCHKKLHWAEVEQRWRKILLAQVLLSAMLFYLSCQGRTIVGRYLKLFDRRNYVVLTQS